MSFCKCSFSPAAKKYVKEQIPVISKKEAEVRENLMMLGGLLIGFTAGVVVGAGITALTTPRSGAEARQNICDKKDSAVSGVKETSCRVADKIKETADDVVGKIKDKFCDDGEEDVVVEYTIRYDDEDEPTVESCGCGCEEAAEVSAEDDTAASEPLKSSEEDAPSEE